MPTFSNWPENSKLKFSSCIRPTIRRMQKLQYELIALMVAHFQANPPQGLSPVTIKAYTSQGWYSHLDNEYTVIGEVVEGL